MRSKIGAYPGKSDLIRPKKFMKIEFIGLHQGCWRGATTSRALSAWAMAMANETGRRDRDILRGRAVPAPFRTTYAPRPAGSRRARCPIRRVQTSSDFMRCGQPSIPIVSHQFPAFLKILFLKRVPMNTRGAGLRPPTQFGWMEVNQA